MVLAAAALSGVGTSAAAQQPSAAQIEQEIRRNPRLGELVRQRVRRSGLSQAQIRNRLQAAGYPSSLLDDYLATDSLGANAARPGQDIFRAVTLLGLGDLSRFAQFADSTGLIQLDSLTLDSLRADSLGLKAPPPGELQVFGLNVFRRVSTEFLPALAGPVDATYRLGAGDVVVLIITGDVELAHTLEVTREGFVVIPQVGQLFVGNLTLDQLRSMLYDRLGRVYSGVRRSPNATTRFEVTVARVRMVQIYVAGEVTRPGSYQIPSVATVLTALYEAGGPTDKGNFRRVEVRRGGTAVATLDLYDYLLKGIVSQDIRLETGDVVFVPDLGIRASIEGAVRRAAIYELKPGETLAELVSAAGGFRPDAALNRVSISRIVPPAQRRRDGPERLVVDVPLLPDGSVPPFSVEPGDQVTAFQVADARRSLIELRGSVYHPGTYGLRPGMRLSQLVSLGGGFRPAVYAGRAHIERLNLTDSTRFMVQVRLPPDSSSPYPEDVALSDYDIVTIYGREEFRNDRTVAISGMVNEPGRFPYRSGMTLRDLVLMARGLRDGAYLDTAEVARLPADRSGGQLAFTIRAPMDSTYLFERDSTTYRFLPGNSQPRPGAPEMPLEPYDEVSILQQPDFDFQRTVRITGQVRFPGSYALTRKDERLSQLVERAGGLLPTANVEGGRFFRRLDNAGRVNIDLARALERPDSRYNVILQPDDSLDLPEYNPTVRVSGGVNSPTSVLYRQGADLGYYIGNAGGYSRLADKGRVSVRYANGSARVRSKFLFFSSSPEPGAGSVVFVPQRNPADRTDFAALFGSLAQILASTVAIIVVVTRL